MGGPTPDLLRTAVPNKHLAEALALAEQLEPFCEWRENCSTGEPLALWPYCWLCNNWATQDHIAGNRHKKAAARHPCAALSSADSMSHFGTVSKKFEIWTSHLSHS